MHKRRSILAIALSVFLIGIAIAVVSLKEPCYKGKPVKWWFGTFCSMHPKAFLTALSSTDDFDDLEEGPIVAFRSLPQNSVRYLIAVLRRRETYVTRAYSGLWKMFPKSLQQVAPTPVDISWLHWNAARVLAGLGTNAEPAIPDLLQLWGPQGAWSIEISVIRVLRNSELTSQQVDSLIEKLVNRSEDSKSLSAVEGLHRSSPTISRALVLILQRGNAGERQRAAAILAGSDSSPKITLDALRRALSDSEPEVRYAAVRAIERLGVEGLSAKPDLEKATTDENTMVRTVANRILEAEKRTAN